jgi:hypothetical protein
MKKERQETENEKLFDFGTKLRDLVGDINIYKSYQEDVKKLRGDKFRLDIKAVNANEHIYLYVDNSFIDLIEQQIEQQIEQKTAELNELKKHITL